MCYFLASSTLSAPKNNIQLVGLVEKGLPIQSALVSKHSAQSAEARRTQTFFSKLNF